VADGDDDDDDSLGFDAAKDAVVFHPVAPEAFEVAAQGFAKGCRVGGAFDPFFEEVLDVGGRGWTQIAQLALGFRGKLIRPVHATPPRR